MEINNKQICKLLFVIPCLGGGVPLIPRELEELLEAGKIQCKIINARYVHSSTINYNNNRISLYVLFWRLCKISNDVRSNNTHVSDLFHCNLILKHRRYWPRYTVIPMYVYPTSDVNPSTKYLPNFLLYQPFTLILSSDNYRVLLNLVLNLQK